MLAQYVGMKTAGDLVTFHFAGACMDIKTRQTLYLGVVMDRRELAELITEYGFVGTMESLMENAEKELEAIAMGERVPVPDVGNSALYRIEDFDDDAIRNTPYQA